ncbi:hypothetical protein PROFUN_10540 [Planoprotostelium fungivorum]|uniref:Protein kinase domain-containing protein n=1 Tax=Planoprotostelium fungivorum TaxID=1890364 RepID=A0A2P6N6S0_9EUKA|nr:hypothetical protein PROFUN_10540 [Planoprotostelium fungivorum]
MSSSVESDNLVELQRRLMVERLMRRGIEDDVLDVRYELDQISRYVGQHMKNQVTTEPPSCVHSKDRETTSRPVIEPTAPSSVDHQPTKPPPASVRSTPKILNYDRKVARFFTEDQRQHLQREYNKNPSWKDDDYPRFESPADSELFQQLCIAHHRDGGNRIPEAEIESVAKMLDLEWARCMSVKKKTLDIHKGAIEDMSSLNVGAIESHTFKRHKKAMHSLKSMDKEIIFVCKTHSFAEPTSAKHEATHTSSHNASAYHHRYRLSQSHNRHEPHTIPPALINHDLTSPRLLDISENTPSSYDSSRDQDSTEIINRYLPSGLTSPLASPLSHSAASTFLEGLRDERRRVSIEAVVYGVWPYPAQVEFPTFHLLNPPSLYSGNGDTPQDSMPHRFHIMQPLNRGAYGQLYAVSLTFDLIHGADLFTILQRRDFQPLPENLVWKIISQVAAALFACHQRRASLIEIAPRTDSFKSYTSRRLGVGHHGVCTALWCLSVWRLDEMLTTFDNCSTIPLPPDTEDVVVSRGMRDRLAQLLTIDPTKRSSVKIMMDSPQRQENHPESDQHWILMIQRGASLYMQGCRIRADRGNIAPRSLQRMVFPHWESNPGLKSESLGCYRYTIRDW